jgi:hypothetical protein
MVISVHGNLASVKNRGSVWVNWSVRHESAAAADLVSLIGESDAVRIHEERATGVSNQVFSTQPHPCVADKEVALVFRGSAAQHSVQSSKTHRYTN